MTRQATQSELLSEFGRVLDKDGRLLAMKHKWSFCKLRHNEYALVSSNCEMHFLLYFGHNTNIVVTLKPKGRILKTFGHPQMGIYYTMTADQVTECLCPLVTKQDVETSLRNHINAMNESCVRLMNGDLEEWCRYKPRIDRAVVDGMREYERRLQKARQRALRMCGNGSTHAI